jgi:hypothetical protein
MTDNSGLKHNRLASAGRSAFRLKSPPVNYLPLTLRTILWTDFLLGSSTGILGLAFYRSLEAFLNMPSDVIAIIAAVTLLYSLFALFLALRPLQVKLTWALIAVNWLWSLVSVGLLYFYYRDASVFGKLFLVLQIIVVGGLAYFEGKALKEEHKY